MTVADLPRIDPDVVYSIPHEAGEPCAVVVLLNESFGEAGASRLLRLMDPACGAVAWEQAKDLVKLGCQRPMDISSGGV